MSADTQQIKAIETRYAGCHFRSRLEARWAVFFDHLGIEWQYESQSFVGYGGKAYVPDFFLPGVRAMLDHSITDGIYVEVKGTDEALARDADKIAECIEYQATAIANHGLLLLGDVPTSPRWGELVTHSFLSWRKGVRHELVAWGKRSRVYVCAASQFVPRWFDGEASEQLPDEASTAARIWSVQYKHKAESRGLSPDPLLASAYAAARSARFEHGQSGAT